MLHRLVLYLFKATNEVGTAFYRVYWPGIVIEGTKIDRIIKLGFRCFEMKSTECQLRQVAWLIQPAPRDLWSLRSYGAAFQARDT